MKKFFVALAIITCFLLLCSCGEHTHEKAKELSFSETHHWYACTGKKCMEQLDLAEHIWDEGKITKKPTIKENGVKAYNCTVCDKVKLEEIRYEPKTTVKEAGWKNAFMETNFENVYMTLDEVIVSNGISQRNLYKIEAKVETVYLQATTYENNQEKDYYAIFQDDHYQWLLEKDQAIEDIMFDIVPDEDLISAKSFLTDYKLDLSQLFSSFTYNVINKAYEASSVTLNDVEYKNISVKIEDEKIAKIILSYNEEVEHYLEITFTKYSEADPVPPTSITEN